MYIEGRRSDEVLHLAIVAAGEEEGAGEAGFDCCADAVNKPARKVAASANCGMRTDAFTCRSQIYQPHRGRRVLWRNSDVFAQGSLVGALEFFEI